MSTHRQPDRRLGELALALDNLRWAVDQGRPEATARHALLDHYELATDDLADQLRELAEQLDAAARGDDRAALKALAAATRGHARLLVLALERALGLEQYRALAELARESPALWGGWVAGVLDALEPLRESLAAPLDLIAERLERRPRLPPGLRVTAQAVSIGQPAAGDPADTTE